jgi:hypothetical protein
MPVAIQLDASTDAVVYKRKHSRVWTPAEKHPFDWLFAKICVQVCLCVAQLLLFMPWNMNTVASDRSLG